MEKILNQTVGEIVAGDYRTAKIFEKYGIDFCCGGNLGLAEVCKDKGIDISEIARELEAVKAEALDRKEDYNAWDLSSLVEHIMRVHHSYLESNVGSIAAYADKIALVHGGNHPELMEIAGIFKKLSSSIAGHLKNEEEVLFPAVKRIESARTRGEAPSPEDLDTLKAAIQGLSSEHEEIGEAMHSIRRLSHNYSIPQDACSTFFLTFNKLEEFENDLHKHVHLENNILFPKAAA